MVSGIGPQEALEQYNITVRSVLLVGKSVWDTTNIGGPIFEVNVPTADPVTVDPVLCAAAKEAFYTNGTGPLSSEGGDFWDWEKIPSRLTANWSQSTLDAFAAFPADWPNIETMLSSSGGTLVSTVETRNLATMRMSMVSTTSRGNMTISSNSNLDPPVISPNSLLSEDDRLMAIAGYKRPREIIAPMGDVVIGGEVAPGPNVMSDADILAYIKANGVKPIHHGSSTCMMGKVGGNLTVADSTARVGV